MSIYAFQIRPKYCISKKGEIGFQLFKALSFSSAEDETIRADRIKKDGSLVGDIKEYKKIKGFEINKNSHCLLFVDNTGDEYLYCLSGLRNGDIFKTLEDGIIIGQKDSGASMWGVKKNDKVLKTTFLKSVHGITPRYREITFSPNGLVRKVSAPKDLNDIF